MSARSGGVNLYILVGGLGFTAALVAVLFGGFGRDPKAVPSMLVDKPAPDFALKTLVGDTVQLDDLRGKPVILNFWSTWCQPCKVEHPLLLAVPREYPDVAILGVVYADEPAKVALYLKEAGESYPHLVDPGGRVAIDYGVAGVPETFFIDANGTIVHKQSGPVDAGLLAALIPQMRAP